MKSAILALLATALHAGHALDNRKYSMVFESTANNGADWLANWNFETQDFTNGMVNYVDKATAQSQGLAVINPQNHLILTPDSSSNLAYGTKRNSVKISTKRTFQVGSLIVINAWHLPYGCATWPAFWTVGTGTWPQDGEIDIIEGANNGQQNQIALHTSAGCSLKTPMNATGTPRNLNCESPGANNQNLGCQVGDTSASNYGKPASDVSGGVWAVLFDTTGVYYWHFPRDQIPAELVSSNITPNPANLGTPIARYANPCNGNEATRFKNQKIVINIELCGDWAGNTFQQDGCGNDCKDFVRTGSNFKNAYWEIQWVRVFQ
ncbi:glycoside hydrolase family 16 protein [Atractiella rhizophila]|nr:glycoside hydrolase family 16 protein [Atractiella rhizophila]